MVPSERLSCIKGSGCIKISGRIPDLGLPEASSSRCYVLESMDQGFARRQPVVMETVVPCMEPADEGETQLMMEQTLQHYSTTLQQDWA